MAEESTARGMQIAGVPRRLYVQRCARLRAKLARAMRAPGATASGVAQRFGVSPYTVYRACRERGLRLGSTGNVGATARHARLHDRIAAAVKKGLTTSEAARAFRVSPNTVLNACRARSVTPRLALTPLRAKSIDARASLAKRLTGPPRRRAFAALEAGGGHAAMVAKLLLETRLTYAEIAEVCGVSRQRVHQVLKLLQTRARASAGRSTRQAPRRPDLALRI